MHSPNPVQPVQQHVQRFGQQQRQPLQPVLGVPQPAGAEQAIQQQMHELAMEIFARLAAEHISDDHYTKPLSEEHLRQLASHSQIAARAYFEAMGVQFSGQA
jgi:ATP-dependent helicase YprA (DUF1998 family)